MKTIAPLTRLEGRYAPETIARIDAARDTANEACAEYGSDDAHPYFAGALMAELALACDQLKRAEQRLSQIDGLATALARLSIPNDASGIKSFLSDLADVETFCADRRDECEDRLRAIES